MLASVGFAFGAAPSAMRPTSPRPVVSGVVPQAAACVGSLLAARADAQVAPASALIQTSPTFPPAGGGTPTPLSAQTPSDAPAGGADSPGHAYEPLTMKLDAPTQTTSQVASSAMSAGAPTAMPQFQAAALGRSIQPKLAPPSIDRKSPTSVAASTTWELAGSTAMERMLPAAKTPNCVSGVTNWTGAPQVRPPSLDFPPDPPCWSKASPVPM